MQADELLKVVLTNYVKGKMRQTNLVKQEHDGEKWEHILTYAGVVHLVDFTVTVLELADTDRKGLIGKCCPKYVGRYIHPHSVIAEEKMDTAENIVDAILYYLWETDFFE